MYKINIYLIGMAKGLIVFGSFIGDVLYKDLTYLLRDL